MTPVATVILPTTGERWELVQFSLQCIRNQDVAGIEIFLVGDGVAPASRERYLGWQAEDPRVRFFDYPKHASRGEPYRHALLMREAAGRIVLYCCDRDLWFPHHVSTLAAALQGADFAHSLLFWVTAAGGIHARRLLDVGRARHRREFTKGPPRSPGIPLSAAGHTLEAYRRLPEGWTTTPGGQYTDLSMWQKFLRDPGVRAVTAPHPTLLYFNRGNHPGWPIAQRRDELQRWIEKTKDPAGYLECLEAWSADLYAQRAALVDERKYRPLRTLLAVAEERLRDFDHARGRKAAAVWRRLRRRPGLAGHRLKPARSRNPEETEP